MSTVRVELWLGAALARRVSAYGVIQEAAGKELVHTLDSFGIPARPVVQVRSEERDSAPFLRVIVNGRRCLVSDESIISVAAYLTGEGHGSIISLHQVGEWVDDRERGDERVAELVALVLRSTLDQKLSVVFPPEAEAEYLERLAPEAESSMLRAYAAALHRVLDLRISLSDTTRIDSILSAGAHAGHSPDEVAETLISSLKSEVIEIRLSRAYLRVVTEHRERKEAFKWLRDGLFNELGVRYPDFRLVIDDSVRPCGFAFKLNDRVLAPVAGLRPKDAFVGDTADHLASAKARPAPNPANGTMCAVVSTEFAGDLESQRTVWDRLDYLVLALAAMLRAQSRCFVVRSVVVEQLQTLAGAFPELVTEVRARHSETEITRVLRELVGEEVSIQNLRFVLESLLDFGTVVADSTKHIVFDDRLQQSLASARGPQRPGALAEFVRTKMKRYLSHKYSRGGSTLAVYLLASQIEDLLTARDTAIEALDDTALDDTTLDDTALDDADRDRILRAFHSELEKAPPNMAMPAVLTSATIRRRVKHLIAAEFPRVPVLSFQELSPDSNVQLISRIAM